MGTTAHIDEPQARKLAAPPTGFRPRISRRSVLVLSLGLGVAATIGRWLGIVSPALAVVECGNWGYYGSSRWCTCSNCTSRQCWYEYARACCDQSGCWNEYWYIAGPCLGGACGPCGVFLGDGC